MRTVAPDDVRKAKGGHDVNFKPAKAPTRKYGQLQWTKYEYQPLMEGKVKKPNRDEDGKVVIGPRNFTTIPMKRGKIGKLTTFGGPVPYIADPYDNKKKIAMAELKAHHALLQEKPFSQ